MKQKKQPTIWVQAPFGVFELRKGRPAILWSDGVRRRYASFGAPRYDEHSFKVTEITSIMGFGAWRFVTQTVARRLIREQTP